MRIINRVNAYSTKDLVAFGKYLLSGERRKRFEAISKDRLEERLSEVHDADIRNFFGSDAE